GGVLGVLPGIIGSIQALEAIKLITGIGQTLIGRLLLFDALRLQFRELAMRKDPQCPVCGPHPTITALIDYEAFCGVGDAGRGTGDAEVTAVELRDRIAGNGNLVLLDVREPFEWEIAHLPQAKLIPLGELPARLRELDGHADIVAYCHHGQRSQRAVELLRAAGYSTVRNLRGGIDAWSLEVDQALPRY